MAGRAASSDPAVLPPPRVPGPFGTSPWVHAFTLALGTLIVSGFTWYVIAREYKATTSYWGSRISSIAAERAQRVSGWLNERKANAQLVSADPSVRALLASPPRDARQAHDDPGSQIHVTAILDSATKTYGYEAMLVVDRHGKIAAPALATDQVPPGLDEIIRALPGAGSVRIEFVGTGPAEGRLSVVAPVFEPDPTGTHGDAPIPMGAVVVLMDPTTTLYPLLTTEPIPTRTGETLLVRREGEEAVFLSPLRHIPGGSLFYRRPLHDPAFAARAALEGRETFGEYVDYRGVRVFAAARRIPLTGWGIVRKIDREEALADFRRTALVEALAAVLFFLAALGGLAAYQRSIRGRLLARDLSERQRAHEALRLSEEKYRLLFNSMNDAVFLLRVTEQGWPGRFIEVNDVACRLLGYTREELLKLSPADVVPEEAQGGYAAIAEGLRAEDRAIFLSLSLAKDGRRFPTEVSVHGFDYQGQPALLAVSRDITERNQAAEALRHQYEMQQTILDSIPVMIAFLDRESRHYVANRCWQSTLGWSIEEVQHTDILAQLYPDPAYRRYVQDYIAAATGAWGDFKTRTRDGRRLDTSWANVPLSDGSNIAIGIDITERKRAEKALLASEERLRLAVDAAAQQIWDWDLERGEITWSGFDFEALLGYPPGTFGHHQESFLALVHPEDRESVEQAVNRALAGGPDYDFEFRYVKADGTPCWVTSRGKILRDAHGKAVRMIGVARDITERKQSEMALRESEERYRVLFERNLAGIGQTSLDGRILDCNEAFARILGYASREEIMSRRVSDLWFDPAERSAFVARVQREVTLSNVELRLRRKDGQPVWVLENLSLVKRGEGQNPVLEATIFDITKRKRAEAALMEERYLLRTLMDNLPDYIYFKDRESRFIRTNKALAKAFGLSDPAQAVGKADFDFFTHEHSQPALADEQEIIRTGQPMLGKEEKETWPEGRETWVSTTKMPWLDAGGHIIGTFGISRDITERKRTEETLRTSEKKYHELVNTLQEGIWVIDKDSFTTFVNPYMAKLLEYRVDEMQGRHLSSFMDERGITVAEGNLERRRQGIKELHHFELLTKEGRRVHTIMNTAPISDDSGNYAGAIAAVVDISERKRAEEALRESQEMFQKAFHASPDMMVLHTLSEGRHIDVNESFLRLIGYRREEVVGRTGLDLGLWRDMAQGDEYMRILREQGRVRDLEICVRPKSGEARTLLLSAEVIEIAGQDCVIAIGKDISHRKQAEQERMSLEEQLRQAQKMEAVGRLAGGVAHDFNNLLTAINGFAQIALRRLPRQHPMRHYFSEIRKAGEQAASLTARLLAFSRRQILVPEVLDLNKVVADTKEMLRRVIGEDVELVIRGGEKLANVLADPGLMAQVIVNLAVNARDAMPKGGRLTIETGNVDLREAEAGNLPGAVPGLYVMLAVSDTGVGMAKEVMEHIFEPFFTTRRKGKGTGLGLSMVYGIVKQSGGHMWVQSEPGHGSAFRIYLPCAQVGSGKPAARSTKARGLAKGRETILVVEDELAVRTVVAVALRSSGYTVLEANSGEGALRHLRRHEGPLHLVLTDVVMPRMDGRVLADRIRIIFPEAKILFMSGYTDDRIRRHGVSDTEVLFLQKPFTLEALTQKVREVLEPSK